MTLYKSKILNVRYFDDDRSPDTFVKALQSSPQPEEDVLDISSNGYNFIGLHNELEGSDSRILHGARAFSKNNRGRTLQRFTTRTREVYIDHETGIEGVNDEFPRSPSRSSLLR